MNGPELSGRRKRDIERALDLHQDATYAAVRQSGQEFAATVDRAAEPHAQAMEAGYEMDAFGCFEKEAEQIAAKHRKAGVESMVLGDESRGWAVYVRPAPPIT